MESFSSFLDQTFMGITLAQYLLSFSCILGGFLARFIFTLILHRAARVAEGKQRQLAVGILHSMVRPVGIILIIGGVWAAVALLPLPNEPFDIERLVHSLLRAGMVIVGVWLGIAMTEALVDFFLAKARKTETPLDDQLLPMARSAIKLFLVVIGGVSVLQELGYSVSSLIAGLGLGGAAVAFASRDTLSNLFGSLVIFVDRPFHIGDWIEIGDIEGTVEEVGLRVTRIRTFANSLITLPNSQLTTTAINNWSRMKKRRIRMTLGVTYDTTPKQMQKLVEQMRETVRSDDRLSQDFFLINFHEFGPSSLDIFVYVFTATTNWAEYMQVRQELLLKFMDDVRGLGLSFAFPSQSIYVESLPDEPDSMKESTPR